MAKDTVTLLANPPKPKGKKRNPSRKRNPQTIRVANQPILLPDVNDAVGGLAGGFSAAAMPEVWARFTDPLLKGDKDKPDDKGIIGASGRKLVNIGLSAVTNGLIAGLGKNLLGKARSGFIVVAGSIHVLQGIHVVSGQKFGVSPEPFGRLSSLTADKEKAAMAGVGRVRRPAIPARANPAIPDFEDERPAARTPSPSAVDRVKTVPTFR